MREIGKLYDRSEAAVYYALKKTCARVKVAVDNA
jgi:hypothetical protein